MRATLLAFTLVALGTAQAGTAQNLTISGNQIAPMGWAANESAYAAAAREIDTRFLNRTISQPDFTPQSLSSEIEQNLESRLDASLERQLEQQERLLDMQVGTD
ncbi:MAG: hypothetical protein GWP63_08875 [Haliea sp.]|jgi:hypothetical protein|nr:hypothetical protein [Haliea sp.]